MESVERNYKSIFDDPNWDQRDIERCRYLQSIGQLLCDSVDHNENEGCSNPRCWKYKNKEERIK